MDKKRNILIIGSGGREHAIAKKLLKSKKKPVVHTLPGSSLWRHVYKKTWISANDLNAILDYCNSIDVDYVIVGPEEPLANGIVDFLNDNGIKCFGPSKYCAQLEGSKSFSKILMNKCNIPTAKYLEAYSFRELEHILKTWKKFPLVIKSSNLAGGKGVLITNSIDEALAYGKKIFEKHLYGEDNILVIEEFLEGFEYSLLTIVRDKEIYSLPVICDHKRVFNYDKGPNTGGMGIYNNPKNLTKTDITKAINTCVKPLVEYLSDTGNPYYGVLFTGIMKDSNGEPKVIEYNVRFGDPETEGIMELLQNDLVDVFDKYFDNKPLKLKFSKNNILGVVLAAPGYPESYKKDFDVSSLKKFDEKELIIMGAKQVHDEWLASGGRIAMVICKSKKPFRKIYNDIYHKIENAVGDEFHYRTDIGRKNF